MKKSNRATKIVPTLRNLLYEERLQYLNLITLEARDTIVTCSKPKKINGIDHKLFFSKVQINTHSSQEDILSK